MVRAWRNFKNIYSRPLFTIIFWPKMLKFHPYSILTGDTMVCVLNSELDVYDVLIPLNEVVLNSNFNNKDEWLKYLTLHNGMVCLHCIRKLSWNSTNLATLILALNSSYVDLLISVKTQTWHFKGVPFCFIWFLSLKHGNQFFLVTLSTICIRTKSS